MAPGRGRAHRESFPMTHSVADGWSNDSIIFCSWRMCKSEPGAPQTQHFQVSTHLVLEPTTHVPHPAAALTGSPPQFFLLLSLPHPVTESYITDPPCSRHLALLLESYHLSASSWSCGRWIPASASHAAFDPSPTPDHATLPECTLAMSLHNFKPFAGSLLPLR